MPLLCLFIFIKKGILNDRNNNLIAQTTADTNKSNSNCISETLVKKAAY